MARIIARVDEILKLAIDRRINPTAHAIANATGITYETMRRTLNGYTPSEKTMAALMLYFGVPWDDLFYLESPEAGIPVAR
jgi:transcriptional regulator with XRE-family HTH domain